MASSRVRGPLAGAYVPLATTFHADIAAATLDQRLIPLPPGVRLAISHVSVAYTGASDGTEQITVGTESDVDSILTLSSVTTSPQLLPANGAALQVYDGVSAAVVTGVTSTDDFLLVTCNVAGGTTAWTDVTVTLWGWVAGLPDAVVRRSGWNVP